MSYPAKTGVRYEQNTELAKCGSRAHEDLFIDLVRIYLGLAFREGDLPDEPPRLPHACDLGIRHRLDRRKHARARTSSSRISAAGRCWRSGWRRACGLRAIAHSLGAVFSLYLPRMANVEPRQYLEYAGLVAFSFAALAGILVQGDFPSTT
jgi:hypothetical protein